MRHFFTPVVTTMLVINGVVFLLQMAAIYAPFLDENALMSPFVMHGKAAWHGQYWRLVTSMFMHGSIMHLAFNMLALFSFGYAIEKSYGSFRFLLVYLIGGVLANVLFGVTTPNDPAIGASGAVSTVLMLSALKFPSQIVIVGFVPMPIRVFIVGYVLLESFSALGNPLNDNVAHFAHIGGLVFGYLYFKAFDGKVRRQIPS